MKNKTGVPLRFVPDNIKFDKPHYTVERGDINVLAKQYAESAGERFTPTPPPYVPSTYQTRVSTSGNTTHIVSSQNNSGQLAADALTAATNALAAHSLSKFQNFEAQFSHFLVTHAQTPADDPIPVGATRKVVNVFDELKAKKSPFTVTVIAGDENFSFAYKE